MAFDGITVSSIVKEMNDKLIDARLFKIAQTEQDELILTFKRNKELYRLMISANASLPLVYFTSENKASPLVAPSFCMLLRKHLNNGKIISINQPGLERIINIEIEHLNEMGDLCHKVLIIELMGKHSNIIFCENNKIIDSIKHISANISSIREVLPGREYFIPQTMHKIDLYNITEDYFLNNICTQSINASKALYTSITGLSPIISEELCSLASLDSSIPICELTHTMHLHLFNMLNMLLDDIKSNNYSYNIYYKKGEPVEFSAIPMTIFSDAENMSYSSISEVLEKYYAEKNFISRMRQRSADLRQIVQAHLSKCQKKYDLQLKQLNDTKKRDKYKVYGELITAFGYQLQADAKELVCENYYDNNKEVKIPLDSSITPMENAKKFFDKYTKLKRTNEALTQITKTTKSEIDHLESIQTALNLATTEDDLKEVKEELVQYNYIKRKSSDKKSRYKSKPLHFVSSENHDIYVGKNNYQNEYITFHVAVGNDIWFHAKGIPGSHVLIKTNGDTITDKEYEECGRLAAHFSKGASQDKVEVDYIQKKSVKKVNGAAPGFVIYHTNYSMLIDTDISNIFEQK